MHESRELEQVQRWMQAVITHPDGIAAGIGSRQARAEIDVSPDDVEQVVERSRNLTSIERLAVYGNAYYARLLECLREEFPALVSAVGEEAFDALAFGYLQTYPSQSYTLANLAGRFPQYLRETRPTDSGANGGGPDGGPSWPDFMIDLAQLERIYSEVFDGPGVEGQPLLSAEDLLVIPPDRWPETRLKTVDCLRLVRLNFPAHEYATAVKKGEQPPVPEPRPTFLAVSRREYIVRRWEISSEEFSLLDSLQRGETVGDAIRHLAESRDSAGLDLDQFAERLRDWFHAWTAAGGFQAVR